MFHNFQITDNDGIIYRIEFNSELQRLNVFAEYKISHPDFPDIKWSNSLHAINITPENGIMVFDKNIKDAKERHNG